MLVAFQSLLAYFNQPFRDMARLGSDVQELRADLDRIDDVRNRPIDSVFISSSSVGSKSAWMANTRPRRRDHARLSGHIEFRRVTFGYNRTVEEPLIKDFSFVARPGQRIALVGSSGSGKSTIGRLAAGLYQPWSGEILYDGKCAGELPREVFVNTVELVDSNICLFEGSVRDNLTLWDEMVPTRPDRSGGGRRGDPRRLTAARGAVHARSSASRGGISRAASASDCKLPGRSFAIPAC